MADIRELKERAYQLAQENIELYNHICDEIFRHPELGEQEVYSSRFLVSSSMKSRENFRMA